MDKRKLIIIGLAAVAGLTILGWLIYESNKPKPGQKIVEDCSNYTDFAGIQAPETEDKCRIHVPVGSEVKYGTNPPVFGPHYAEWTKAGIFDTPLDDRNTTHSLEHGYVIMYYKCEVKSEGTRSSTGTPPGKVENGQASPSAELNFTAECQNRKSQLEAIYSKKGKHKQIVVGRPSLDTNYALAAWGYLDKFDEFDEKRITTFIDAHLDHGPEKTMES